MLKAEESVGRWNDAGCNTLLPYYCRYVVLDFVLLEGVLLLTSSFIFNFFLPSYCRYDILVYAVVYACFKYVKPCNCRKNQDASVKVGSEVNNNQKCKEGWLQVLVLNLKCNKLGINIEFYL